MAQRKVPCREEGAGRLGARWWSVKSAGAPVVFATTLFSMFTGLVQAVGVVRGRLAVGEEVRLEVAIDGLAQPFRLGDSIALSGVCCTVVQMQAGVATFHLTGETLQRTWLGAVPIGTPINLEGALRAGEPLGGHLVQGHVDGVGRAMATMDPGQGGQLWVEVPTDLRKYCVEKGSITLDGVSLTIAERRDGAVRIAVIPHTAQMTTLGLRKVGEPLHIEVDVLAKYVESLLAARLGSA